MTDTTNEIDPPTSSTQPSSRLTPSSVRVRRELRRAGILEPNAE